MTTFQVAFIVARLVVFHFWRFRVVTLRWKNSNRSNLCWFRSFVSWWHRRDRREWFPRNTPAYGPSCIRFSNWFRPVSSACLDTRAWQTSSLKPIRQHPRTLWDIPSTIVHVRPVISFLPERRIYRYRCCGSRFLRDSFESFSHRTWIWTTFRCWRNWCIRICLDRCCGFIREVRSHCWLKFCSLWDTEEDCCWWIPRQSRKDGSMSHGKQNYDALHEQWFQAQILSATNWSLIHWLHGSSKFAGLPKQPKACKCYFRIRIHHIRIGSSRFPSDLPTKSALQLFSLFASYKSELRECTVD